MLFFYILTLLQKLVAQHSTAGRNQSLTTSSKIAAAAHPPTTPDLNGVPKRSCSDGQ